MKTTTIILTALLILLSACSTKADLAIAGEWELVSYGDTSNPTSALTDVDTSIIFGKDGKLNGNVGCNSFGGEYKLNNNEIVFGAIFSTLMFCEAVSSQESMVLGILSDKSVTFQIDENLLTITSADGASTITLARK